MASLDYILSDIMRELGNPPIFMLDLWPASFPFCIITNHEDSRADHQSIEAIPWSTPKTPVAELLYLAGPHSIISLQGEEWKSLRKRFNPGFAPSHSHDFLPIILDKTWFFLNNIDSYARTGEEFSLGRLTANLTFDIIGAVSMETDFHAQHLDRARQSDFILMYRALLKSYTNDEGLLPRWIRPWQEWKRYRLSAKINSLIRARIQAKYAEMRQLGSPGIPKYFVIKSKRHWQSNGEGTK